MASILRLGNSAGKSPAVDNVDTSKNVLANNAPPRFHLGTVNPNSADPSSARPVTIPPSPRVVDSKPTVRPQVPPRPKPPIPANFFIRLPANWHYMPKSTVRAHVVKRFAAREKYDQAYKAWEKEHNRWVFGVYQLVRTIKKSQLRAAPKDHAKGAGVSGGLKVSDNIVAATRNGEVLAARLCLENVGTSGTALTNLEEDAEADQQDRIRRWFMTQYWQQPPPESLLPTLQSEGPGGAFGSSAKHQQQQRLGHTLSIELPPFVAHKICAGLSLAPTVNQGNGSAGGDYRDKPSQSCWRIFSNECACGYAGCHCDSWFRWWDETLAMLAYVEYADIPARSISKNQLGPVPFLRVRPFNTAAAHPPFPPEGTPGGGSKGRGQSTSHLLNIRKYTSLGTKGSAGTEQVHDSHELKNAEVQQRKSNFQGSMLNALKYAETADKIDKNPISRTNVESVNEPPLCNSVVKLQPDGFVEDNPKLPGEYSQTVIELVKRIEPNCAPLPIQFDCWVDRLRFVNWIAQIDYYFNLPSNIFYLAVNMFDRYLGKCSQPIRGIDWYSMALACYWSAWKYEGSVRVFTLDQLLGHFHEHSFLNLPKEIIRTDIIQAEWTLHQVLDHNFSHTSALIGMRLGLPGFAVTAEVAFIARFLCDVSLTIEYLVTTLPCAAGVAALWLARELMGIPGYSKDFDPMDYGEAIVSERMHALIGGLLDMPLVEKYENRSAISALWTKPEVNNVAGWCQSTLHRIWPDGKKAKIWDNAPRFRAMILSGTLIPFKLEAGPPLHHPTTRL